MSQTIDDFKDFYLPNKEKEIFVLSEAVNKAIHIIKPLLKEFKIEYEFVIKNDSKIYCFENEYSQIVLNLLTNAKDVLVQKIIQKPKIQIILDKEEEKSVLKIIDNARGVDKKIEDKIFEPYFSTKDKSSGIGLYMSKIIVEKHFKGELILQNSTKGACFIVRV